MAEGGSALGTTGLGTVVTIRSAAISALVQDLTLFRIGFCLANPALSYPVGKSHPYLDCTKPRGNNPVL